MIFQFQVHFCKLLDIGKQLMFYDLPMFDDLPIADNAYILRCLETAKRFKKTRKPDNEKLLEIFFSDALTPYYDCMFEGLKGDSGNIIFALSEQVPEELRRKIEIYPNGADWHSLEDWRTEWLKNNSRPTLGPTFPKLLEMLKAE